MSYVSYKALIRLAEGCRSDKYLIRHIRHWQVKLFFADGLLFNCLVPPHVCATAALLVTSARISSLQGLCIESRECRGPVAKAGSVGHCVDRHIHMIEYIDLARTTVV